MISYNSKEKVIGKQSHCMERYLNEFDIKVGRTLNSLIMLINPKHPLAWIWLIDSGYCITLNISFNRRVLQKKSVCLFYAIFWPFHGISFYLSTSTWMYKCLSIYLKNNYHWLLIIWLELGINLTDIIQGQIILWWAALC